MVQIAIATCPNLERIGRKLTYHGSAMYSLRFQENDRSCQLFYGKDGAGADFHWDEHHLFQYQTSDFKELGRIIELWIFDHAMPSALQKEFPSIKMKKTAQYYEEGRGVEGEFVESWDDVERLFQEDKFTWMPAVLNFVADLRQNGYDHIFRAGQSMHVFILSRSRRHRLKPGQPNISFDFEVNRMDIRAEIKKIKEVRLGEIKLCDEVRNLLSELAAEAIT